MYSLRKKYQFYKERYRNSDERSKEALVNIVLNGLSRGTNIVSHLLVVPLTIYYLNPERYGIWLTLSSIIGWVSFFDLGLSHGFRNRFAEARALGNIKLAKQYLSTTYFALSVIILSALVIVLIVNAFLDWSAILKVSDDYREELNFVFAVIIIFTCINMIANIFISLLAADQKVGYGSMIQAVGQLLSLFAVFLLSKTTQGSLTNLALFYSGVPCMVILLTSIVLFYASRYRIYRPSYKDVKIKLIRNILDLGVQFFIIHVCMILIFQIVNIVISRELGAESVSIYNIANKYFNVIYMTAIAVISPFWSAFTDAYTKRDYVWMKNTCSKLYKGLLIVFFIYFFMILVSKPLYHLWIGNSLDIPFEVTLAMAISVFVQTYGALNMYLINGIGAIRLQTIIYAFYAVIAWPLFIFSCRWGLVGVIAIPALVYLTQGISGNIQLYKIINKKANGIWLK